MSEIDYYCVHCWCLQEKPRIYPSKYSKWYYFKCKDCREYSPCKYTVDTDPCPYPATRDWLPPR